MKHLLMLGGGEMQMPALRAAKRANHWITLIEPNPRAPGLKLADQVYQADLADTKRCLDIAAAAHPDGVMTFAADYPMPVIGRIADALGLPGPGLSSIRAATDKAVMRQTLEAAGVPVPGWRLVYSLVDVLNAIADLATDVILKPSASSGGRGVTKIRSSADQETVRKAYQRARKVSPDESAPLLLEEYVDGPEFSVEAITVHGKTHIAACTDKVTSGPPYFVEIGHRQPTALADSDRHQLETIARKCIGALCLDYTASHTEIRFGACGPVAIEVASRCGGGYICSHLVPLSTGIDMADAAVSVALGFNPRIEATKDRGAAIAFLRAQSGIVVSMGDLDRAREMPGVVELNIPIRVGDRVPILRDARDRVGYCICEGSTAVEAAKRCETALSALSIHTSSTTNLGEAV